MSHHNSLRYKLFRQTQYFLVIFKRYMFRSKITIMITRAFFYKGKGKAVPLQAWSGPQGSRKLRFPDFSTTAQYGGKVVSPTHRPPLPPGNTPGTHFC
jgi:hypothetical protein